MWCSVVDQCENVHDIESNKETEKERLTAHQCLNWAALVLWNESAVKKNKGHKFYIQEDFEKIIVIQHELDVNMISDVIITHVKAHR